MPNPVIIEGEIWEQTNPTFLARVTDENGVVLLSGDVEAPAGGLYGWDLRIFDETSSSPETAIHTSLNNVVVVVTDGNYILAASLQTAGWTLDTTGYNFRYTVPSTVATFEGGHTYRYEFRIAYKASAGAHVRGNAYVVARVKHKPVLTE